MQLELDKKSRKSLMAYKAVDECFHYWSSLISLAPLRLTFEVLTHQADFLLQCLPTTGNAIKQDHRSCNDKSTFPRFTDDSLYAYSSLGLES